MSKQISEHDEPLNETQEVQATENNIPADITPQTVDTPATAKPKSTKKKLAIIAAAAAVAIIAIAIAIVLSIPSKFEEVERECIKIAGMATGGDDYFTLDTYPDEMYENMDEPLRSMLLSNHEEGALEAIRYANEALGFNGSVYSKMLETSALMGRQSEENDKYKVSWTFHPDDGLEVTYEIK